MQAYPINKPWTLAKMVSRMALETYPHLKPIWNNLHLSGRTIDLWIGTDFPDAFNVHMISGKSGEMIAKRNYFGWYVIRLFAGPVNQQSARISSVDFGTVSMLEDMKKLLTEDLMGVRPTELCTCRDLQENNFIKSILESTKIVDRRVQVWMPWREDYTKIIDSEVQKLVELDFLMEIPTSDVNHIQPEWYLPLHAVFTLNRTTQVRQVIAANAKGPNGKSLNDHSGVMIM